MAYFHLRLHEFDKAVHYAEAGLAIADRYGLTAWGIHRPLPILAEALLWLGRFARVEALSARLRAESIAFDHPLGLASADGTDALLLRYAYKRKEARGAVEKVVRAMELLPLWHQAARLWLNHSQLSAEANEREEAIGSALRAYGMFAEMEAVREFALAKKQLLLLGEKPPKREVKKGDPLTRRENGIDPISWTPYSP